LLELVARLLRNATYNYVDLYRISWRNEHRKEYPKITTGDELFLSANRGSHTTKELACTYRFPMVLRDGLVNKRMSVAHDARHDRKSSFCDFLWWILLITHGGRRIKPRIVCTKPLGGETLGAFSVSVGLFSGVVLERPGGWDEEVSRSSLDSDILVLSGYT
jgi:hypothetical protein